MHIVPRILYTHRLKPWWANLLICTLADLHSFYGFGRKKILAHTDLLFSPIFHLLSPLNLRTLVFLNCFFPKLQTDTYHIIGYNLMYKTEWLKKGVRCYVHQGFHETFHQKREEEFMKLRLPHAPSNLASLPILSGSETIPVHRI